MADQLSFSPEQKEVIHSWGRGQAIIAGAGCGKSTTLVEKCMELLRRNPKAKFCAVSFTDKSALDLEQKFSEKIPDFIFNRSHWVKTIHGLCGMIVREHPEAAGMQGDERVLTSAESTRLWDQAMEWLWFESLPLEVSTSLDRLLERESRDSVIKLISRVITLMGLGYQEALSSTTDTDARALYQVAEFVKMKYERLKVRTGVIDFSDLEQKALLVLGHPSIRTSYQSRFDLVLVDEFQDTNWVQGQIISLFVKPDYSNLCVVGDPKQSIYRFRDADISVFEEFCNKVPLRQKLSTNYRSRPGIISFVNAYSKSVFENLELHYDPLNEGRAKGDSNPVLTLAIDSPKDLATYLLNEKNAGKNLGNYAILMRKIRGNAGWLDALDDHAVPYVMSSGGFFWDDPRVRELVALLKAWNDPSHRLSAAVFLRAPWLGLGDELVHRYMINDELVMNQFLNSNHPLALALIKLNPTQSSPMDVLKVTLFSDAAEQELGVAWLGLVHRVQEWVATGMSFTEVVNQLERKCETLEREAEVPPPGGQGQVQVLTIHGSKGLEFPHVILVDFGKRPKASETPLLFSDRKKGIFLAHRDEDGDRLTKDPEELAFKNLEKKKNLEESARLLYVAQTRARESLTLVLSPREWKEDELDKAYDSEDWRAWFERSKVKPDLEIKSSDLKSPTVLAHSKSSESHSIQKVTRKFHFKHSRHSLTEWLTLEKCPRQYEWRFIRPRRPDTRDLWSEEKQDEGKRVHRALELGDPKYLGSFTHPTLLTWMQESPLLHGERALAEYPFELKVFDNLWVGVVDRIQWSKEERFQLIDFKLTSKRATEAEIKTKYARQLQSYTWAMGELGLYSKGHTPEIVLVQIHPKGIDEIKIEYDAASTEAWIRSQVELSDRIVNDPSSVIPKPDKKNCAQCSFKQQCDVSAIK